MPTISGNLNLVTDRPVDSISEVWVRARETRGQGDGLTVGINDRVPVEGGAVEFTALPGAAVLVLLQNGMPIETLPMLVGDEAQQSLRLVVQAAQVAGAADQRVIEQLSAEIAANTARSEQYRTEAAASASSAQASESAATASESNAKTSENNAKQSETNAGEYAAVATTAATEAVDAMDAAALSAAAFSIYTGTGFPEGKVEAPVGSVYTDSAATAGAIRWVKASGTGNTGWVVEYGDTGWRDITNIYLEVQIITGDVLTLGEGAKILVRRTSNTLSFGFRGQIEASRNWTNLFQLPFELMPGEDQSVQMPRGGRIERDSRWIRFIGAHEGTVAAADTISIATFTTNGEKWPTSLPGDPA